MEARFGPIVGLEGSRSRTGCASPGPSMTAWDGPLANAAPDKTVATTMTVASASLEPCMDPRRIRLVHLGRASGSKPKVSARLTGGRGNAPTCAAKIADRLNADGVPTAHGACVVSG